MLADTRRLNAHPIQQLHGLLGSIPIERLVNVGGAGRRVADVGFHLPDDGGAPAFGPLPEAARPVDLSTS